MYEQFYGLREEPFRLSPDSRMCFMHPSYSKAKAYMQYALQRKEGFVMVTGRPGTGKTTLINDITARLASQGHLHAALTSTQIGADDLLRLTVLKFGLSGDTHYKAELIHRLENYLFRLHREGRRPLLIIDEAQDLAASALEELRLLTNLQKDNQPLLQIFLVGQEELRETILAPGLEQLHQRIVAACHLSPLTPEGTKDYITASTGPDGTMTHVCTMTYSLQSTGTAWASPEWSTRFLAACCCTAWWRRGMNCALMT